MDFLAAKVDEGGMEWIRIGGGQRREGGDGREKTGGRGGDGRAKMGGRLLKGG